MTNAETYESWNVAPARERNRSGDNDENDAGSPSVEAFDDLASAGIAIVRNTTTETHSGAISFGWRRDEAGKIIGRIAREKTFTVEDEVTTDFSVKISVTGISSLGDGIRYHLVRVDEGAATIVLDTNSASLRRLVRISDDSIQFTA